MYSEYPVRSILSGYFLWNWYHHLIGIAVVMLILATIMSVHMANKIVEPINNVDLEHPEENQIYEEVGPLLSKILQTEPTDQESAGSISTESGRVWHYYRKHAGRSSCY